MDYLPSGSRKLSNFKVVQSIFEAGIKLEANPLTIATATSLYHRFFEECDQDCYDSVLIAATSMYLAGKVEENHLKIRDVINVFYKILNPDSEPLDLGEKYWCFRDSIVHCELLLLRMLGFKVSFNHPHRYLLHYLKSLTDWLDPEEVSKVPISRISWSIMTDIYHDPVCLKYPPKHIAVSVIYMVLQIYGISVTTNTSQRTWHEVFCEELSTDQIWNIMEDIISIYDKEHEEISS